MKKILLCALVFVFIIYGRSFSEEIKDLGSVAFKRGDYVTALKEYSALASDGNSAAQYNVGLMFFKGIGVKPDCAKAAKWLTSAALNGDADAQHILGVINYENKCKEKDVNKAVEWFLMAA